MEKLTPNQKAEEIKQKLKTRVAGQSAIKFVSIMFVEEILDELNEFDIMDDYATSRIDYYNEVRNILKSS